MTDAGDTTQIDTQPLVALIPADRADEARAEVTPAGSSETVAAPTAALGERPRTRWAAIIWGLAFAGMGAWGVWVLLMPSRRSEFVQWLESLSPEAGAAYALLAVGATALLVGLSGIARRAQRQRARRRAS